MNSESKPQFAKVLRELMNEKGLSISALSRETGIPRTSINNWLNQNRSPNVEYLNILAKFFDVSIDYLLGLKDD